MGTSKARISGWDLVVDAWSSHIGQARSVSTPAQPRQSLELRRLPVGFILLPGQDLVVF
jgi:hypothetical protein